MIAYTGSGPLLRQAQIATHGRIMSVKEVPEPVRWHLFAGYTTSSTMMRDGLRMCWQVVFHPNSAFAAIRDDYRKYFPFSIGLALLMIIPYSVVLQLGTSGAGYQIIESLGWAAFGVVAYIGAVYLIGIVWSGNPNWMKVFTVMCYTYAAAIAAAIVLVPAILLTSIIFLIFGAYYATGVLMIAEVAWLVIINIKAVKVVNGFGTAKAFVIVVLAFMVFGVLSLALPLTPYLT